MSDPYTYFGDVRSAAHRADPDALVAALEAIEASGDPGLLHDALTYAHEVLWRCGWAETASALGRWPHPDALPALTLAAASYGRREALERSTKTGRAPSHWVEQALLDVLAEHGRSSTVWETVLSLDLPRIHRAALEHSSRLVVDAARVPADLAVASPRKRESLIRARHLSVAEIEKLGNWAGDDFELLCVLANGRDLGLRAKACGRLLEHLARMPREHLAHVCSAHPGAHAFATGLLGRTDGFHTSRDVYSKMSPERRRIYRSIALETCAADELFDLAYDEPDADEARRLARVVLARLDQPDTYYRARMRFPDVTIERELEPTIALAFEWMHRGSRETDLELLDDPRLIALEEWMRRGCRENALELLDELPLTEREPWRNTLAHQAVAALLDGDPSLTRQDVDAIALLPMMFEPIRRALRRAGPLPGEFDTWRSTTYRLPPEREEVEEEEQALPPRPPRARRGAPKSAPRPRHAHAIEEYLDEQADLAQRRSDREYDQEGPDERITGVHDGPGCTVLLIRHARGLRGSLSRLAHDGEDELVRVLDDANLSHLTLTSGRFVGPEALARSACARADVAFDSRNVLHSEASEDIYLLPSVDLRRDAWRERLHALLEEHEPGIAVDGLVSERTAHELAAMIERYEDCVLALDHARVGLRAARTLDGRLGARAEGRVVRMVRALVRRELVFGSRVSLGFWDVRDEDLELLATLTDPTELDLRYTQVTDTGLEHIIREGWFPRLRRLDLDGQRVTFSPR